MKIIPIKRALLSVSDKQGIVNLAQILHSNNIEIISTGGTSKALAAANIPHRKVEEITQLPEMLGGRVKTLHPKIHGGILGQRDLHEAEAAQHDIHWIDLVVVNFYPFQAVAKQADSSNNEIIEHIDIGGPTMVRAAAKNYAWTGVVIDPSDYSIVIEELKINQGLSFKTRQQLAQKAFAFTSQYDAAVSDYFSGIAMPEDNLTMSLQKKMTLRYGENPHQKAFAYCSPGMMGGILNAHQHQGKALSYNNIVDSEAALALIKEFSLPAAAIVKHANPCGVSTQVTLLEAYTKAYAADSLSAFGGVIALNKICTPEIAAVILQQFVEIVLAPGFTDEALKLFNQKPNLRVLNVDLNQSSEWEMKFIEGGLLYQEKDLHNLNVNDLKIVTKIKPDKNLIDELLFAWHVVKHVKSNAIVICNDHTTLGVGAGQVSRVDAVELAIKKSGNKLQGAVLASDAFFPFRDSIDHLAKTGIRAIIQPGGSIRDEEVIAACDEHNIAMVFTGIRCFKH